MLNHKEENAQVVMKDRAEEENQQLIIVPAEKRSEISNIHEKHLEIKISNLVKTTQKEEDERVLMQELAAAEYQIPLQIAGPNLVVALRPDTSVPKRQSTVVAYSGKSVHMENLHAIITYQVIEEKVVESKESSNAEFVEDKGEEDNVHNVEETCKGAGISPMILSKAKR